jgi:four helix bundle protein
MRKHHELRAWQEALLLVTGIYQLTGKLPKEEVYVLMPQMRRAAVSVPSNIAEGAARNSDKEFLQFLFIARASLSELETQIQICRNLGYITDTTEISARMDHVFSLLGGLIKSIQARSS